MRFTVGLLAALGMAGEARTRALSALSAKNMSELKAAAAQANLSEEDASALLQLPALYGPVPPTLNKARALCRSKEMEEALDELADVLGAAGACAGKDKLQLDFSIAGDTDYYNGLMLRGYINGLPRAVLLGGRYDNILHKLGKAGGGTGFAIDLSEIARLAGKPPQEAIDLLIRYEADCDVAELLAAVSREAQKGLRVRALPAGEDAGDLTFTNCVSLDELKGGGNGC